MNDMTMKAQSKPIWKRLPFLAWGGVIAAATVTLAIEQTGIKSDDSSAKTEKTSASATVDEKPAGRSGGLTTSFAPVVKKVSPSVVRVFTTTKSKIVESPEGFLPEDPFGWFFGPNRRGRGLYREMPVPRQQGVGSGVIVTAEGYILTNNHVVDGADEVKVALQDGREFSAKVIGKDTKTDVAVLKVEGKDLPFIEMADSDRIEVGDLVLAIGNPFGIGQTVTMGMVSAKGRANMGLDYEDFIQTDAAINPGNSGGALVDGEGRLIGINTAILSRTGGNQGIGFAIPTNLAKYVMDSFAKDGRVARGYLGVIIQDLTPALASKFRLDNRTGALIGDVASKSPAERAGIKEGDVITEFNGKEVKDSRQLRLMVSQTKPGTEVPFKIVRDGSRKTIKVTLKELPDSAPLARADSAKPQDEGTLNGVTVSDLDTQTRRQLELPADLQGALVTDVEPYSAAADAGLRRGDVILEINRERVRNADDAVRMTEQAKDKTTLLRVWREGNRHYLVVDESQGK